jgi:ribokinase
LVGLVGDDEQGAEAVSGLRRRHDAFVITLGQAGSLVCEQDQPPVTVPSVAVDVLDSTSAGDAFCGVLAAEPAGGYSLVDGVRNAVRAGAVATTSMGARGALSSRSGPWLRA